MAHFEYKAFISYKHVASSKFANNLEFAVKNYAKPLWQPPMKIFRDEKYLVPGLNLGEMIFNALESSEFFIYLASPEAAESDWVSDELKKWCSKSERLDNLIIVLTHGMIAYDTVTKDIDWENTNALPEFLSGKISKLPLYVDCSELSSEDTQTLKNAEFKRAVNQIVAKLRRIDPIQMSGRETRQHRKNILILYSMIAAVTAAIAIAAVSISNQLTQKRIALANKDIANAQSLFRSRIPDLADAALLGINSMKTAPSPLARDVLHQVAGLLPGHLWEICVPYEYIDNSGIMQRIAVSSDNKSVIVKNRHTEGTVHDLFTGKVQSAVSFPPMGSLSLLRGGNDSEPPAAYDPYSRLVGAEINGVIQVVEIATGRKVAEIPHSGENWLAWTIRGQGRLLAALTEHKTIVVIPFSSPSQTREIPVSIGNIHRHHSFTLSSDAQFLAISTDSTRENSIERRVTDTVTIYRTDNFRVVDKIMDVGGQVEEMHFSNTRESPLLAVSTCNEKKIRLYRVNSQRPPVEIILPGEPKIIRFSERDSLIAVAASSDSVSVYDTGNGGLTASTIKRYDTVDDISFDHDDRILLTAAAVEKAEGYKLVVDAWDLDPAARIFSSRMEKRDGGEAIAFHPEKPVLAVGRGGASTDRNFVDIIDQPGGRIIAQLDPDPDDMHDMGNVSGLCFSDDGRYLVAIHWGRMVTIWEMETKKLIWQGPIPASPPERNAGPKKESPVSNLKAMVERMKSECHTFGNSAWSRNHQFHAVEIRNHEPSVKLVNGNSVIIEHLDGSGQSHIINVSPDNEGSSIQIDALAMNPDGSSIAIGIIGETNDGNLSYQEVQIWKLSPVRHFFMLYPARKRCSSWRKTQTVEVPGQLDGIQYSRTGKYLAFRDNSGRITVLDGNNGELLNVFTGIEGSWSPSPPPLVFSPDEEWLATCYGPNGGPALWRMKDDKLMNDLRERLPEWLEIHKEISP